MINQINVDCPIARLQFDGMATMQPNTTLYLPYIIYKHKCYMYIWLLGRAALVAFNSFVCFK